MNAKRTIIIVVLLLAAAGIWFATRPDKGKIPEVPLGVEHAVTITYSGPELTVQPYKFGVPVNLRIASVIENDGIRTYDVRYMLNSGGEFNVTEYLAAKDGSPIDDLPAFTVIGLEHLSQNMDQRIQQVEAFSIDVWHWYYECLGAAIALWVIWLLLLIFYGRPKQEVVAVIDPVETFYDNLRAFLTQIENQSIDVAGKARMEMLLINWWRQQLGYGNLSMHEAMRQIGKDDASSAAFAKIQNWLHNPNNSVSADELVASLRPLSVKPANSGADA